MSVVGLSDHDLRRLHQVQLEMLCEFDRVCRLLGLNYQLGAGSLLGAVRHGGFIPWDDDVDVVMLRADYERLLREGPPLLDRRLFLQTWRSDPHFQACFAKLRRHGSTFREEGCQWSRQHHGIYIDIFPFDPVWPDHSWWGGLLAVVLLLRHLMHRLMALASHHQAARLASWRPAWQRWPGLLAHRLLTQVPPRLWMAIEAGLLRCLRLVPSPQVVCLVSGSIRKQRLQALARPVAEFERTVMLEFEGLLFPATAAYRDALTRLYGDYQQLPTPELRRPRHPVVEFRLPELECDEPAASGPVRGGIPQNQRTHSGA